MQSRLAAALENDALPPELLHIVALTQEALILLDVETTRFKPSSVIRVYKLSAVGYLPCTGKKRLTFISAGAEL
jgi:N-terminal acetyltransferase B complex non-catalytic subunit